MSRAKGQLIRGLSRGCGRTEHRDCGPRMERQRVTRGQDRPRQRCGWPALPWSTGLPQPGPSDATGKECPDGARAAAHVRNRPPLAGRGAGILVPDDKRPVFCNSLFGRNFIVCNELFDLIHGL